MANYPAYGPAGCGFFHDFHDRNNGNGPSAIVSPAAFTQGHQSVRTSANPGVGQEPEAKVTTEASKVTAAGRGRIDPGPAVHLQRARRISLSLVTE
jgi:hypothetical protein